MVGYSEYFNRLYFQSTYVKVGFSGWLRVGYSEYFEQLYFQSTYEYNLTLPKKFGPHLGYLLHQPLSSIASKSHHTELGL